MGCKYVFKNLSKEPRINLRSQISIIAIMTLLVIYTRSTIFFKSISTSQTQAPSWLNIGAYARYNIHSEATVSTYSESLDLNNCTLALLNTTYINYFSFDPEIDERFIYRWEVTSLVGSNVTLDINIGGTNWINDSFIVTINEDSRQTHDSEGIYIGYSCFWLTETQRSSPDLTLVSSPVWIANCNIWSSFALIQTIQGYQNCLEIEATEYNYSTPIEGYRSRYTTSILIDDDSGLFIESHGRLILPFPTIYRFIVFTGGLYLESTNVDLGPDVLVTDPGSAIVSLIILTVMVITVVFLSIIIFHFRRRSQRRKIRRKIRRKRE